MDEIRSKINPLLSLEYMIREHENKVFDRKSANIKVADIAPLISAFANAEGGTIIIGINDKTREIEGIYGVGDDKINDFITAPKDCCKPMPQYKEEFLHVTNNKGKEDRLLLLHIEANPNQIVRTIKDSTFLRIGDRTKELKGDDLRNLEYNKSIRHYEDECNMDAKLDDLDNELLKEYQIKLQAENIPIENVLRARGFIRHLNGKDYLTNAAVLLFAKNIMQFYPNCRIRFVRYDGTTAKSGTEINITKDYSIDLPILRIINRAKEFIGSQLRDFTALDEVSGTFLSVPEYPEFAWLEGIVNAVTHREYSMEGNYIKVNMFDDRMEIESPGKLPNIVTIENIKETRYARNPRISRVLTEFGWVRELNEGVKRIYSDMNKYFLDDPIYNEPGQAVRLTLKNNIVMRSIRQNDSAMGNVGMDVWKQLDDLEHQIVVFMASRTEVSRSQLEKITGKSTRPISNRLNHLIDLGVITSKGAKNDPKRSYSVIVKTKCAQVNA